jgi:hypothetical protein
MFNTETFEAWFESQCGTGKPCANFYPIDDEQKNIISDLKGLVNGLTLVLFQPEIKSEGTNVDSINDIYRGLIFVLQYGLDKNSSRFESRKAERKATFEATLKVRQNIIDIARGTTCHFWNFLRYDSFEIHRVGPVFDGFYGWSLDFDFTINTDSYGSF